MRLVLRKYYLLLVCTISLFTANNSLQAQNVLDQAGLTSATPAAAAYATRKLSSSYTGAAVRIRRQSDNAEADLAFDVNGTISANSLAIFVSGGTGSVTLGSFAAATNAFVSIWYDQSGNGRNATQTTAANQPLLVSNGVVVTSSVLNSKATLSFNGSAQFMDLPMSSSIINAAGTISAVQVQPVLQSGFNAVVAWSLSGGTKGPGFGPLNSAGAFGLYTTWGPNNITLGPVAINQAYVLNATWSGNGNTVEQSRNGTIVSGSLGASFNYTGNAWIGRDAGAYYNGNLAELIVSNTTITAGNRTAMETNQNNAYTNAGALNFDGSNDYVNLGNILGASYTKEAWVNISNAAAVNNFISGGAASQHAFWAPNAYGNRLSAGHNEIWNQVQDPTPLVVGQWYHVAVTYDAATTTMKLYKNGALVSSNTAVPVYNGGGNVVLLGAYDLSTNLLAGSLDETRIWSRVLCQTEIQNNMNAMLSGTQTGLTAYYKFNQGITAANNSTITTVTDASGNNRTGTMVGFNNTGTTSNWVAGLLSPTAVSPVYNTPVNLISGLSSVCVNGTTTLTNSSTGTWSSSNTAVATISASGVVTGVSAGTTTITFTGICSGISNLNFTVNPLPVVTAGSNSPVLVNGTINLTATGADTYSWTGPNSFNSTQQNPTISNATNLSSGKYTVTATTTATGCAAIASTNVAVNKPFTAVVAFDPRKATSFAGSGISGATDGTGTAAQFNNPSGIAIDASGNLYVSETSGHRIRKITAAGVVTTVAGSGVAGNVNGTGIAAKFNSPRAVALDPTGTILYVADNQNYSIRKIVLATGAVTTYAGTGTQGNVDGPSATAKFVTPTGVTVDPLGNVYVADLQLGNRIRKISTTGIVSTVYNGLTYCSDIIQDINGNLITTAMIGYVVEKVSPDSIKTRVAGSGLRGSIDGPAATATFNFPMGLTMDAAGNIFLTENDGNRIRKISAGGNVTTVAGSGAYSSIDGIGTGASIYSPNGVVMDAAGNLFVTEYGGHKIRKLSAPTFSAFTSISGTASAVQQINISGASLSGNITVTAPAGFEVSLTSNASFASSITVNATANEVASTIIYVRLAAAAPVGVYNANLSLSATGATTQTMPLNGTVTCPVTTASITNATPGINLGNTATLVANSGGGNAIKFNGTNTYLDLGTGPVLPNTFTQEAWIYSGSGNDGLFHGFLGYQVGGNSATRPPSMYIYNGTAIHGGFGDGTGFYYYITQPGQILQNTWNHIAQTFDGTTLRCYVNGVLASNATYISPAGKTPLATGVKNIGRVDNYFNGDIDEVRMWNVTRTQAQIQADMNKGIPTNTTGLVSYFKMEEGSGLTTADTKSGTTASLVNAPVWTVSSAPIGGTVVWSPSTGLNTTVGPIALASPATTTTYTATVTDGTSGCAVTGTTTVTVFDQPATALALDGSNDYVKVADNASLDFGANDFTVETWTLKQANSVSYSNSGLVGKWNTGSFPGTNEWILNNTSNGTDNLPAFLIENGTSFYRVAGTTPMILNQWYHLAAVKKGALLSLYVNGVLAATTTIPANTVLNNVGRDLLIGGYIVNGSGIPTLFSSAKLDELRIWNRALCQAEIQNNRNGELTGTQNGLIAYYKFNQGFIGGNNVGISTLTDASGNNNNGTLFNFASTATGNWVAGTVIGNSPTFVPTTASITGTTSACIGATSTLANTNPGTWSSSNNSVATVNAAGQVTAIAAGTTTITFTNSCGGISTVTFTVNPKPTASISTASPLTVCLGSSVLLDASTNASPATFQWFKNGVLIPTATNTSFNALVSGSYTVVVTSASGCVSNTSNALVVTIEDIIKPYFNSGGTVTSATNAQGQVLATSALGAVVTYTIPVAADNCTVVSNTLIAGQPSGSVFPIGLTTITYQVTDGAGLTETSSFDIVVSGLAPSLTAPANITVNNDEGQCGATVNFAATGSVGVPAATITYTEDGQPVVSGSSFAIGVHTITAIASNAVGTSSVSFTITVVNTDHPTITAQGPTIFCEDGSVTLTASEGSSYYWSTGETSQSITVYSAGTYSASVTNAFGCATNTNTITTTTIALPTAPEITGVEQVCANSSTVLTSDITGGVWTSANESIATVDAQGKVTGVSEGSVQIMYSITNESGCTSIGYFTVFVKPLPLPGVITGITDICVGGTSRLDVSNPNGRNDDRSVWTTSNASVVTIGEFPSGIDINGIGLGTATITKTLTLNGCSAVIATAVINVRSIPIFTVVPENKTVYSITNQCNALVSYLVEATGVNTPTLTYSFTGATTANGNGTGSGLSFNVGITNVTITATNQCGSSNVNFTVTVTDIQDPVISAPANITINATSAAGAMVTYVAPVGTDNCSATTVRTAGLASGSVFPIGINTVTYTVTDASGNTASASFTVTVVGLAPVVLVPENITVNVDENTCGAAVSFAATDNTGIPASTITYTENGMPVVSGATFSTGLHTITATATNAVGSSSASFTITVIDNQIPVISAPANISVIATSAAGAMVTYVAPVGTDNCGLNTVMTAGLASGSTFPIGVTTVTYTATDASGNTASASFTVTVRGLAPVIVVPENITQNNDAGQCGASVSFAATETTAIPASTIVYTENEQVIESGHFFTLGVHTITATATNAVGSSSATFTITIIDTQAPTFNVAIPADVTVECTSVPAAAVLTATDNCSAVVTMTEVRTNGNSVNDYTLTRTWTATDASGNTTVRKQVITVRDTQAPSLTVPANISVFTDYNVCGAAVSFAATATDNCSPASISYSHNPGTVFPVGITTVTVTATDPSGNATILSFTVSVTDKQKPVALAKNITVGLSAVGGTVSITAADVNNGSSDACGIASMTVMPSSFSCANVGANTVTLTVTDVNGNVSTTTAIVTVVDDKGPVPTAVLPVISGQCSVKLVIASSNGAYNSNKKDHDDDDDDDHENNGATVITAPTAMDNCSGLIKGTTTDPLTYYNQGTYIIRWKFVDARGNVTIQEQTVIVKDTQAPRPKYASLPTITGQCSVSIVNTNSSDDDGDHEGREGDDHDGDDDEDHYDEHQRGAPWAKDNCSGWIRGTTTDPLTYSVQGTYIIRWTFNDGHGNISTQNQTVIVADVTKPKIKAPNDKTVTCGSNTAPAVMGMATATDNCSVPVITYTDVNSGTQIVRTWRATDAAGNFITAVQTIKLSTAFSGSVVSVPTSNVYTGGEVNNLYLGYGAQGTALTVSGLPSSGAPYTYSWSGVATNRLSATNTGAPVFSPIAGGVYTFTVTMTNKNGCSNTASISICVTDIRVPGSNGALVYVCHKGSGKTGGTKTLQVPVAQVASHIQTGNCGGKNDRLGSCDQNPCNSGNNSSAVDPKQLEEPIEVKPEHKAAPVVVEELKVVVMPNPTTTYFTIRLESKDKAPVNLRVMDGSGRVIDAKQKMEPNSSFQMGHGYSSGTYYAEFIQGNKRKVIQLIKGRG